MAITITSDIRISKAERAAIRQSISDSFPNNNGHGRFNVAVKISRPKRKTRRSTRQRYHCWYCGNRNGHKEAFINNFHRYFICLHCGASTQPDGGGSNLPRIGKGRARKATATAPSVEAVIGRRVTASKPLTDAEERAYNTRMKRGA